MELFLLGVVVGVVGAKGKRILKPIARGYLELTDRAREIAAEMRENFEDALAEARYEREQESAADERGISSETGRQTGPDSNGAAPDPPAADGLRGSAAPRSAD